MGPRDTGDTLESVGTRHTELVVGQRLTAIGVEKKQGRFCPPNQFLGGSPTRCWGSLPLAVGLHQRPGHSASCLLVKSLHLIVCITRSPGDPQQELVCPVHQLGCVLHGEVLAPGPKNVTVRGGGPLTRGLRQNEVVWEGRSSNVPGVIKRGGQDTCRGMTPTGHREETASTGQGEGPREEPASPTWISNPSLQDMRE